MALAGELASQSLHRMPCSGFTVLQEALVLPHTASASPPHASQRSSVHLVPTVQARPAAPHEVSIPKPLPVQLVLQGTLLVQALEQVAASSEVPMPPSGSSGASLLHADAPMSASMPSETHETSRTMVTMARQHR